MNSRSCGNVLKVLWIDDLSSSFRFHHIINYARAQEENFRTKRSRNRVAESLSYDVGNTDDSRMRVKLVLFTFHFHKPCSSFVQIEKHSVARLDFFGLPSRSSISAVLSGRFG